ncbi:hypothetical protein HSB1_02100 [Halogranum salarium B-1]|uniref:Uncharacterized protein n=1 Tax=Halogranum salarium B-1 TaxID=1210908 RepID=J3JHP3_9EURY|nr:hypothetical protein HSB1_02100 [Halogranum salarium B-1]
MFTVAVCGTETKTRRRATRRLHRSKPNDCEVVCERVRLKLLEIHKKEEKG